MQDERFAAAQRAIAEIPGWLTDGQARMLFDAAARTTPGQRIVEIGSFWGRSTIILCLAAPPGVDVVAIDPYPRPEGVESTGPREIDPGDRELQQFWRNLRAAGVADRVRQVRKFSGEALDDVEGPVDLLFVDGAHDYATAHSDVRDWGARVPVGGTMLVHDAYSSVGVTATQITELFFGSRFRYVGRSRSLAEYRREHVGAGGRLGNAARQVAPLPWFLRNVLVKVGLAFHLPALARALGHEGTDYPY